MSKMIIIYRPPADPAAFDKHYFNVHVPLAKRLPGLQKFELSQGKISGRFSQDHPYLVAILSFGSMDDMQKALSSDVGKACAVDRRSFAPNDFGLNASAH